MAGNNSYARDGDEVFLKVSARLKNDIIDKRIITERELERLGLHLKSYDTYTLLSGTLETITAAHTLIRGKLMPKSSVSHRIDDGVSLEAKGKCSASNGHSEDDELQDMRASVNDGTFFDSSQESGKIPSTKRAWTSTKFNPGSSSSTVLEKDVTVEEEVDLFTGLWMKEKYWTSMEDTFRNHKASLTFEYVGNTCVIIVTLKASNASRIPEMKKELLSFVGTAKRKDINGRKITSEEARVLSGSVRETTNTFICTDDKGNFYLVGESPALFTELECKHGKKSTPSATSKKANGSKGEMRPPKEQYDNVSDQSDDLHPAVTGEGAKPKKTRRKRVLASHNDSLPVDSDTWHYMMSKLPDEIEKIKSNVSLKHSAPQDGVVMVELTGTTENVSSSLETLTKLAKEVFKFIKTDTIDVTSFSLDKKQLDIIMEAMGKEYKNCVIDLIPEEGIFHLIGPGDQIYEARRDIEHAIRSRCRGDSSASVKWSSISSDGGKGRTEQRSRKTPYPVDGTTFKAVLDSNIYHIHLMHGDITECKTDVIVNAADELLINAGGVSRAIAKAAGAEYEEACRNLVINKGSLKIAEPRIMRGGDLEPDVIHVVGPKWDKYNSKQQERCVSKLKDAFLNCLLLAEKQAFQSIALPAISSGTFGVPANAVADQMVKATVSFLLRKPKYITDIILIDMNKSVHDLMFLAIKQKKQIKVVKSDFMKFLSNANIRSSIDSSIKGQRRASSEPIEDTGDLATPGSTQHTKGMTFTYRRFKVHIVQGDITQLCTTAIVNAANEQLLNGAGVAAAISKAAGPEFERACQRYIRKNGDLQVGSATVTQGYQLHVPYIIHVVGPRRAEHTHKRCLEILNVAFFNCMKTADDYTYKCKSIAIPAVSSGIFGVPPNDVAGQMFDAVMNFLYTTPIYLEEVVLIDISRDFCELVQKIFSIEASKPGSLISQATPDYERFFHLSSSFTSHKSREGKNTTSISGASFDRAGGQFAETGIRGQTPLLDVGSAHGQAYHLEGASGPTSYTGRGSGPASYTTGSTSLRLSSGLDTPPRDRYGQTTDHTSDLSTVSLSTWKGTAGQQSTIDFSSSGTKQKTETCCICMETPLLPKVLGCKHAFCRGCIDEWFKTKPTCPSCGVLYGELKGNQPDGTMTVTKDRSKLPGHEADSIGTIVISYYFSSGYQGPDHPQPGKRYDGTSRTAYLPDSKEGNEILALLRRAWDAKLIFTIGKSTTTGAEGQITWNDIHHKTSNFGGPDCYGYPDPTYLARVRAELADKGIK